MTTSHHDHHHEEDLVSSLNPEDAPSITTSHRLEHHEDAPQHHIQSTIVHHDEGRIVADMAALGATAKTEEPVPTVGRIVHYVLPSDEHCRNIGQHRPAVIVKVWSAGSVNLQVFTDGTNDYPFDHGMMWRTSVPHSEQAELGSWHWPEKA